ncbi:hypothetical protein FJT64_017900 [Amphibalanus amphitrite]|uniref:Uncharacterized protein n=1 Tax=Amphibalanus amphitrite TaxID=1232801 RepID=A0A6A4XA56_AMPAM|nr:hypothetical protein FJT64_017900 [Amphibalanus amphitrite]
MEMGRALMTVLLLLVCWCCRPAAAVEIRIARGLDTNSTFMAPRPTPPEEKPISIPPHNYSKPAHNYTHAVIGQSKHKVWIRQLHYKVGSRVRVDQVSLTEVFNASKVSVTLRTHVGCHRLTICLVHNVFVVVGCVGLYVVFDSNLLIAVTMTATRYVNICC